MTGKIWTKVSKRGEKCKLKNVQVCHPSTYPPATYFDLLVQAAVFFWHIAAFVQTSCNRTIEPKRFKLQSALWPKNFRNSTFQKGKKNERAPRRDKYFAHDSCIRGQAFLVRGCREGGGWFCVCVCEGEGETVSLVRVRFKVYGGV